MIISRDEVESFIPRKKPKMVILGTMVSINARNIGNLKRDNPFFYHNNQNRFWKIMQVLFEKNPDPPFLNVDMKRKYLEKWQVAVANIVYEIQIPRGKEKDASDEIIFEADKKSRIKVKTVSSEFKKILASTPLFFTCLRKPGIESLLNQYFIHNGLDPILTDQICYLRSPTRCKLLDRSAQWREKIEKMGLNLPI